MLRSSISCSLQYSLVIQNPVMYNALSQSKTLSALDEHGLRSAVCNLSDWGCCPLCILRFLGERDPHVYRCLDEKDLQTWLNHWLNYGKEKSNKEPDDVNTRHTAVCVACLGVLQPEYSCKNFLDELSESVKSLQFEFKTFLCSISLPVSLMLRDHSIELLMRELHASIRSTSAATVASSKDVWKWINGPALASRLKANFDQNSLFEVILSFVHEKSANECQFLSDIYPDVFRRRKGYKGDSFTRVNVTRVLEEIPDDLFRRSYSCPPRKLDSAVRCEPLSCETKSVYVAGRYNKMSRALSQTPWLVDGQRRTDTSIEELITHPINKYILASATKFSASGREDVDVRMLGSGRPFAIEFINPRRVIFTSHQLHSIQMEINSSTKDIAVRDLQIVNKDDTSVIKDGEEEKTKKYSALCWSKKPVFQAPLSKLIESIGKVELEQKTPLRVLHRRPLATRRRVVHSLSVKHVLDEHHFVLSISTQAGTYVKEFVHGDFGRTLPNLSILLNNDCDILELDVEAVELDWPKSLESR